MGAAVTLGALGQVIATIDATQAVIDGVLAEQVAVTRAILARARTPPAQAHHP